MSVVSPPSGSLAPPSPSVPASFLPSFQIPSELEGDHAGLGGMGSRSIEEGLY